MHNEKMQRQERKIHPNKLLRGWGKAAVYTRIHKGRITYERKPITDIAKMGKGGGKKIGRNKEGAQIKMTYRSTLAG